MSILNRFPNRDEILPVYAVGVTFIYSWAIIILIQDSLPRWSLYFNIFDILVLIAYILFSSFVESLFLISSTIVLYLLLPKKIFAERFILRGTILTTTFLGSIIYYYVNTQLESFVDYRWRVFFVISTLIMFFLGETIKSVSTLVVGFAEKCIIFLYIYIPLSLVAIVIVVLRNLR